MASEGICRAVFLLFPWFGIQAGSKKKFGFDGIGGAIMSLDDGGEKSEVVWVAMDDNS